MGIPCSAANAAARSPCARAGGGWHWQPADCCWRCEVGVGVSAHVAGGDGDDLDDGGEVGVVCDGLDHRARRCSQRAR
eukprot:COSAG04_NODE_3174_length_3090_cov_1.916750_3_plen_78_part_00